MSSGLSLLSLPRFLYLTGRFRSRPPPFCILFEILTTRPLFPGQHEFDQITKINTLLGSVGWYLLYPDYSYTNIPTEAVGQWAVLEFRDKTATLHVLNGNRYFSSNIAVDNIVWKQFATTEDIASAGLTPATIE